MAEVILENRIDCMSEEEQFKWNYTMEGAIPKRQS